MGRSGESLFASLVRAHAVAQSLAADLLFECGASVLEAWLLEEIPATGDRCATELAHALDVPTSTVTRALRRFESYGYVTISKGTFYDARVLRPALTAFGAGVRKSIVGFEHELDRMLLGNLRPLEQGALIVALSRIASGPRTIEEQPRPPDPPPPSELGTLSYEAFAPLRPPSSESSVSAQAPPTPTGTGDLDPFDVF